MKQTTKTLMISAALTGLLGGAAAQAGHTKSSAKMSGDESKKMGMEMKNDKHACKGHNACKGKGGCKTDNNSCKGQNACKGKGGCATDGSMDKNSCKGKDGCGSKPQN